MPTYAEKDGQRTRIAPMNLNTRTPYWTRVLQMGRGRYHRGQQRFSREAEQNATVANVIEQIAKAYSTNPKALFKDDALVGAASKFVHYIVDNPNPFAAARCLEKAEGRVYLVR